MKISNQSANLLFAFSVFLSLFLSLSLSLSLSLCYSLSVCLFLCSMFPFLFLTIPLAISLSLYFISASSSKFPFFFWNFQEGKGLTFTGHCLKSDMWEKQLWQKVQTCSFDAPKPKDPGKVSISISLKCPDALHL